MSAFVLIFLSLVGGWFCRRIPRFPADTARALNAYVICVALPAVVLEQFPRLLANTKVEPALIVPVIVPWLVLIFSFLLFRRVPSRATAGALVLCAGLGNTSFVGFPLLEALLGSDALRFGVLIDQVGSFLALSFLGIPLAAAFQGKRVEMRALISRVVTFPPFLALIASAIWYAIGMPGQQEAAPVLSRLGGTLVPFALFAVGFQIRLDSKRLMRYRTLLALGLAYKLLLAPLGAWLLSRAVGVSSPALEATVLEAAMAPMVTAAVIAAEFELDSDFASLMVGIGIPISLLTVPLIGLMM